MADYTTLTRRQKLRYPSTREGLLDCVFTQNGVPSFDGISVPYLDQITYSWRTRGEDGQPLVTPGALIRENAGKILRPWDTGHEFHTKSVDFTNSHANWYARGVNNRTYRGPLVVAFPSGWDSSQPAYSVPFSPVDLSFGSRAIAMTSPTKPASSLLQGLLEIIRDMPKIPLQQLNKLSRTDTSLVDPFIRGLAGDFLGGQFAWLPLVSDVLSVAAAVVKCDDLLKQYVRDSGPERAVRRRYEFDPIEHITVTERTGQTLRPFEYTTQAFHSDFFSSASAMRGSVTDVLTSTERYWFSGAFCYSLPTGDNPFEKFGLYAALAKKILGTRIDAEILWELSPWTWLADWFFDTGILMKNISMFQQDGLVLRYGYLMRETTLQMSSTHRGLTLLSGNTGSVTSTIRIKQKERVRATPYGFGLSPSTFDAQKWSILVALGLTNGNRQLL
jgi:hypothetical protein